MKTPRYFSRTLAAGGFAQVSAQGHYLTIISISAGTIEIGLDGETPEQVRAGLQIESRRGFGLMRIRNSGLVAGTIVFYVSEEPMGMVDASIAAALASIDTDLDAVQPAGTHVLIPSTLIAQTGVGSTQLVAANGNNLEIEIVADMANANYIYLGTAATVTAANSFTELMAGGAWSGRVTTDIWACSTNGTELARGAIWRK